MFDHLFHNGKHVVQNVPILRVGDTGKFKYDEESLKKIVNSFCSRKESSAVGGHDAVLLPKLYIGHETKADLISRLNSGKERPSVGRIDNLRIEQNVLFADYIDISDDVWRNVFENDSLPNRSTEIIEEEGSGKIALFGVALLGSSPPRVALPDMILNSMVNGIDSLITDKNGNIIDSYTLQTYLDDIIQKNVDTKVDILMKSGIMLSEKNKEVIMPETNVPQNASPDIEKLQIQLNSLTAEMEKAKQVIGVYEKQNETLNLQIKALQDENAKAANTLILNGLEADGYIIPPEAKEYMLAEMAGKNADARDKFISLFKLTARKLNMQPNANSGSVDRPTPGTGAAGTGDSLKNPFTGKEFDPSVSDDLKRMGW